MEAPVTSRPREDEKVGRMDKHGQWSAWAVEVGATGCGARLWGVSKGTYHWPLVISLSLPSAWPLLMALRSQDNKTPL